MSVANLNIVDYVRNLKKMSTQCFLMIVCCVLVVHLCSCTTTPPPRIENKSDVVYRRYGNMKVVIMHSGETLRDVVEKHGGDVSTLGYTNGISKTYTADDDIPILIPIDSNKSSFGSSSKRSNNNSGHHDDNSGDVNAASAVDDGEELFIDQVHKNDNVNQLAHGASSTLDRGDDVEAMHEEIKKWSHKRNDEMSKKSIQPYNPKDKKSQEIFIEKEQENDLRNNTNVNKDKSVLVQNKEKSTQAKFLQEKVGKKEKDAEIVIKEVQGVKTKTTQNKNIDNGADELSQTDSLDVKTNTVTNTKSTMTASTASNNSTQIGLKSGGFKCNTPRNSSQFTWPIHGRVIKSFKDKRAGFDEGMSIAAPIGTPVRSAGDGTVVYSGNDSDRFGNLVMIKHSNDYITAYAHNSQNLVKRGQHIKKGEVIAKVGDSGAVEKPQLYFSMRHGKNIVDPDGILN